MMKCLSKIIYIFSLCFILHCFSITSDASAENTSELIKNEKGRIISVSHYGDTGFYPANSLEAVVSARDKGADAVSVAISRTADGEFVLCEDITLSNICNTEYESISEITLNELKKCPLYDSFGNVTDLFAVTLSEALQQLDGSIYLILDIDWQDKDEIYNLLCENNALSYVSLRADVSAEKISEWNKKGIDVVGTYKGNIIWNSINHINKLSEIGMTMAEYRTKNHFNVCYGTVVGDTFSADGMVRALACAYNEELCGKRSDSPEGWDNLINDGFTVIETNNIEGLVSYIFSSEKARESLCELRNKAENMDMASLSDVSKNNINAALEVVNEVLTGRAASLNSLESAYSELMVALTEKRVASGQEYTEGALNITFGKIIIIISVGAVLLGAQVFVEKKRNKK